MATQQEGNGSMTDKLQDFVANALRVQTEALLDDPVGVCEGNLSDLPQILASYQGIAREVGLSYIDIYKSVGTAFEKDRLMRLTLGIPE